ncbi:MAG: hypothetical protein R3C05_01530 [Pirellulaceae bacterium]
MNPTADVADHRAASTLDAVNQHADAANRAAAIWRVLPAASTHSRSSMVLFHRWGHASSAATAVVIPAAVKFITTNGPVAHRTVATHAIDVDTTLATRAVVDVATADVAAQHLDAGVA